MRRSDGGHQLAGNAGGRSQPRQAWEVTREMSQQEAAVEDRWLSRGRWQAPAVPYLQAQGYLVAQTTEPMLSRILSQYAADGYVVTHGPPQHPVRPETDLDRGFGLARR